MTWHTIWIKFLYYILVPFLLKELILIPCSKSKNDFVNQTTRFRYIGEKLSEDSAKELGDLRRILFTKLKNQRKIVNDEKINAYLRYSGRLYNEIKPCDWETIRNNDDCEIIIISALYGLIFWNEPIVNYELSMNICIDNKTVKTWWKNKGLSRILTDFINKSDFQIIRSFLSNDYSTAIQNIQSEIRDDISFLRYCYSDLGSGSTVQRGKDVSNVINRKHLQCPNSKCKSTQTYRLNRTQFKCKECEKLY